MNNKIITELTQKIFHGEYTYNREFKVITNAELESKLFRLDALNSVRKAVASTSCRTCKGCFTDLYRDLDGYFSNKDGDEVFLSLGCLWDTPWEWWRDTVLTPAPRTQPIQLRVENRERLRVIFSIYRACFPEQAMLWGVRADNDNNA